MKTETSALVVAAALSLLTAQVESLLQVAHHEALAAAHWTEATGTDSSIIPGPKMPKLPKKEKVSGDAVTA